MPDKEPADRIEGALNPNEAVWGRDNPDIPTPEMEERGVGLFSDDDKDKDQGAEAEQAAMGVDSPRPPTDYTPSDSENRVNALHYSVQFHHGVSADEVVKGAEKFLAFLEGGRVEDTNAPTDAE